MKKRLQIISLLFVIFSLQLKAQCPLNTAVDFTATDIHGQEIKLFDILDGGQYVLIDFFFTTCGPCQQVTPHIKQAYERLGCNQNEVFFMEISVSDNDAACTNWTNNYGIEYPTISTNGGGATICSQYGIPAYPTVILIAPDRNIVIQDLWPISNSTTIVDALAQYGIQEHECGSTDCPPATNVQAVVDGSSVKLTWDAPISKTDESVIFFEDFESYEDFSVPSGWMSIDADGDGKKWLVWTGAEGWILAYNGTNMAGSFSWNLDTFTPDNYLISPMIEGSLNVRYFFSVNDEYPSEHYAVMASTTGTDISDFTTIFEETATGTSKEVTKQNLRNEEKGQSPWFERIIELPEGTKYVAFRHFNSTDQHYIVLDDISFIGNAETPDFTYTITKNGTEIAKNITETTYTDQNVEPGEYDYCVTVVYPDCTSAPACATITGINDVVVANSVRIFPNPAIDVINVEGDVTNVVIYNSLGQAVKAGINNGQIDVTSLQNGIYYLVITGSDDSRKVEKVIIAK